MLERNVADGIHRVEDSFTNWYLVEDGNRLTVVDAGVPASWRSFHSALRELGRSPGDVDALVLTHAHFDHIGFAEKARSALGIPVYVHEDDVPLTRHPRQYGHDRWRSLYFATKPRALPMVASFIGHRAWWPQPVERVTTYTNGELPVPGRPRVVPTPGHTLGHCSLHFPDRNALIAGDALVTLDPYLGERGPRIVAAAATVDPGRALASLDAILETGAKTVLGGHGDPWPDGIERAVEQARRTGAT